MDINLFRGLMTALLLVLFVGVWVWAWLPGRKRAFDEAARLPLDDERGSGPLAANSGVHAGRIRDHRVAPTERDAPMGDDR